MDIINTCENYEMLNCFQTMELGLNQLIAFKGGDKSKAKVTCFSIPVPIYDKEKISKLRKYLGLSQRGLATLIGVSRRTVESWEIGRTTPIGAVSKLLYLIETDPEVIDKLITKKEP